MTRPFSLGIVFLFVLGCGSGSSSPQANPCATAGATYLETLTQTSGTCGPIASQVVNVSPDGTLTLPTSISCASTNQTGCTARDSDCAFTSQGFDFTETFSVTFAKDGSSAAGVLSLSGTGMGMSCSSSYKVTFTRQ